MASQEHFTKFKEELTPLLPKIFQKIEDKGRLSNALYEASIILIPKLDRGRAALAGVAQWIERWHANQN